MLNHLRSQSYKLIKTPIFWFMLLWPILILAIFISYYSATSVSPEQKLSGYFQVISFTMICLLTLVCTYVVQEEENAGSCFNLLCIGSSRISTLFSLFILLAFMTAIGMIVASAAFYLLWGNMSAMAYVFTTIFMLIPLPCLLCIQLFFALKFGRSYSIAIGMSFLLVSALGVTGLLDRVWYYLPPVWAPRFTSLVITDVFHPAWIIQIAAELRHGLLFCLIFTLIVALLLALWFYKWDGRPHIGDE